MAGRLPVASVKACQVKQETPQIFTKPRRSSVALSVAAVVAKSYSALLVTAGAEKNHPL